jgi:hypothetical protein
MKEEISLKSIFFDMKYYETYYYANIINNILRDQFTYLRNLNDFYGDGNYVRFLFPYEKFSAFHQFIEFIIENLFYEEIDEIDLDYRREREKQFSSMASFMKLNFRKLPIEEALDYYQIEHITFENWLKDDKKDFSGASSDDIYNYYSSLFDSDVMQKLIAQLVEEVFFILFLNRDILKIFNEMIADVIADVKLTEVTDEDKRYFEKKGVLKRAKTPAWVKKAVFYRDRGHCVLCNKDLSGMLSFQNVAHFDHIVPLARGGLNDVTNIQLLCDDCNYKKNDNIPVTSNKYEHWYETETI